MAVTTVVKTIGTTGTFATLQLWEDGAPANLTTSNRWTAGSFAVAAFQQGEVVTGIGITGGTFLDSDSTGAGTGSYITFGTTTTPAAGITITGSTSGATCVISGVADVGVIWEGHCLNEEFVLAANPLLNAAGSTASTTCYKHLTAAPGCSFLDHPDVSRNPLRYNASVGAAIRTTATGNSSALTLTESDLHISKLQVSGNIGSQTSRATSLAGLRQFADQCIFEGTVTASGSVTGTILIGNGATPTIRNCVIVQRGAGADHIIGTGTGSPKFYNCTLVVPMNVAPPLYIFSSGASGTITLQNCGLFANSSTAALNTGSALLAPTTCVSDIDGTAGITQVPYANEYVGMALPNHDYRLARTSLQIDTGTTDATNAATDIVGTARPQQAAYDMGAWESNYVAPSAATKLVARITRLRRARALGARLRRKKLLLKEYY